MITVKSGLFLNAIEAASIGGGEGFVLCVSPKIVEKSGQEVQLANISSSNGEKTGRANFIVHVTDMTEDTIYYPTVALKSAVTLLSKIIEVIRIDFKGSYLELTDEKGDNSVRVGLKEKGMVLELENSKEGVTAVSMKREDFQKAIRLGGYCAQDSAVVGIDCIYFQVDGDSNEMTVMSMNQAFAAKAVTKVSEVKNGTTDAWYLANYKFIREVAVKLTGEMIAIAFTPKLIIIQCNTAIYGCKRSAANVPTAMITLLSQEAMDFSATVSKKDLVMGIDIATVGLDGEQSMKICMKTNEDGSLEITSFGGENHSKVSQTEHEGKLPSTLFATDFMKTILSAVGDKVQYYGLNPEAKKFNPLYLKGEDSGVRYKAILAPAVKK